MSLDFHKEHSVEILLNLFSGLPPTPRGWKPQTHEAVTDLLVDPQPFVSVTAHLTHFISLNCFLISWGQQHCHRVFRALCVLKFQILSFYFIIHLSWKGRSHLEGQECRFRESRHPSWFPVLLFTSRVTLENLPILSGPELLSTRDWILFSNILPVLKCYI